jgi:hypothetical protein
MWICLLGTKVAERGSVDQSVCKFDIESSGRNPLSKFVQGDGILGLSAHPDNDDVFLSAR